MSVPRFSRGNVSCSAALRRPCEQCTVFPDLVMPIEVKVNGELRVYDYYDRSRKLFSYKEIDFTALLPTISSHPRISLITSVLTSFDDDYIV
jgi:hypothetical protein